MAKDLEAGEKEIFMVLREGSVPGGAGGQTTRAEKTSEAMKETGDFYRVRVLKLKRGQGHYQVENGPLKSRNGGRRRRARPGHRARASDTLCIVSCRLPGSEGERREVQTR